MKRSGSMARRGGFRVAKHIVVTIITMAFGWYSDRPARVNPNPKAEPLQERLSQWAGAGFWVIFSLTLLTNTPLLGVPAVLFSAFVIMRRLAAARGFGWQVPSMAKETLKRLRKPALGIIAAAALVVLIDGMGFPTPVAGGIRIALWAGVTGAAIWVGSGYARAKSAERKLHFLHDAKLAAVLGVSEAAVAATGLTFDKKTNELTIFPLPAQAAFKRGDIENKLRQVAPEWEYVDAESSHERVVLASASFATMEARETLAETGGLILSIDEAEPFEFESVDLPEGYVDTVEDHAKLARSVVRMLGNGYALSEIRGELGVVVSGAPHLRPSVRTVHLVEGLKLSDGGRVAKAVTARTGLAMVGWDPEERVAFAANLLPSAIELRDRLARSLDVEPWQIELAPRYANGELAAVTLLRHEVKVPGDNEKRIAFWLDKARTIIGHVGWRVELDPRAGYVHMVGGAIPKLPEIVPLEGMVGDYDPTKWSFIPHGLSPEGTVLGAKLTAGPHSLVVGTTGAGKSYTLLAHIVQALSRGHRWIMIDPSKNAVDFLPIRAWATVFYDDEDVRGAGAVIEQVYAERVRRQGVLREHGVGNWKDLPEEVRLALDITPLTVVIDEAGSMLEMDKAIAGIDPNDALAVEMKEELAAKGMMKLRLKKLGREARNVGIFLVLGIQRPDTEFLPGEFRQNLATRVQLLPPGTVMAAESLRMIFPGESAALAAETLSLLDDGRIGLGVVAVDGGRVAGVRPGYTENTNLPALLEARGVPKAQPWIGAEAAPAKTGEGFAFSKPVPVAPDAPEVIDLGEVQLDWGDLDLDGDDETPAAEIESVEDPFAAEEPAVGVPEDEDPFADAVPRVVTVPDDEDPFEIVPATKAAARVADFEWD